MLQERIFTLNRYMHERFGERVQRISVDAGFDCPNRDGTKAYGGCTYCNNDAFNFSPKIPLRDQIRHGIEKAQKRYRANKFMLYFQAYTNTYAPVRVLKPIYDHVYQDERIVALAIGTRADCLNEDVIKLLESYTRTHEVWLELGVQTIHDITLERINRAETADGYRQWVYRLADSPIRVAVHLILGLPGETRSMMLETIQEVARWPIDGIKCHNLHIVRGTILAVRYLKSPWPLIDLDTCVELMGYLIASLPPRVVIHRLTAETPRELLIAPEWGNDKQLILNRLEAYLSERNWVQGSLNPVLACS